MGSRLICFLVEKGFFSVWIRRFLGLIFYRQLLPMVKPEEHHHFVRAIKNVCSLNSKEMFYSVYIWLISVFSGLCLYHFLPSDFSHLLVAGTHCHWETFQCTDTVVFLIIFSISFGTQSMFYNIDVMFIIENVCKSNVLFSFWYRTFIKTASAIHYKSRKIQAQISVSGRSHKNKDPISRHFV